MKTGLVNHLAQARERERERERERDILYKISQHNT